MPFDSPCRDESIYLFSLSYVWTIILCILYLKSYLFAPPRIEPAPRTIHALEAGALVCWAVGDTYEIRHTSVLTESQFVIKIRYSDVSGTNAFLKVNCMFCRSNATGRCWNTPETSRNTCFIILSYGVPLDFFLYQKASLFIAKFYFISTQTRIWCGTYRMTTMACYFNKKYDSRQQK